MKAPEFSDYAAGFKFARTAPLMSEDRVGDDVRLYPLFKQGVISKYKNRAECHSNDPKKSSCDSPPDLSHGCGFYSFYSPLDALCEMSTDVRTIDPMVMLITLNWGREIICQYGMKTENQLPWAIVDYSNISYCINDSQCPPRDLLERVSEVYELPIIRFEDSEKYVERYIHSEREMMRPPTGYSCNTCGRERVEGDMDYRCVKRPEQLQLYMDSLLGTVEDDE